MASGKTLALGVLVLAVPMLSCVGVAGAETLWVPDSYPTIAEALEQAESGDRVQVRPGVYTEHGLVLPAGVVLAGVTDDPQDTVIDGSARGRILRVTQTGPPSLVTGLTFRFGWANGADSYDQSGGAIYLNGAALHVTQCRFTGNVASSSGGAIRAMNSTLTVAGCSFESNSALNGGGGAVDCSYGTTAKIEKSHFATNLAAWGGAISSRGDSHPEILQSTFYGNRSDGDASYGGASVSFFDSEPSYRFCTFYGNRATRGGAVAALSGSPAWIEHCTITQNIAETGAGLFNRNASSRIESSILVFQDGAGATSQGNRVVQVRCSNVHGNSGGDLEGVAASAGDGNISADPIFCELDESGLSFNLGINSPCVTDAACGTMGAWQVGCTGSRGVQNIAQPPRVLTIEGLQAAPNPFNPSTRLRFELKSRQRIRAEVYTIDGRRIRTLADREFTPGWNYLPWNGQDDAGRRVGSGAYIVRLQGEAVARNHKVLLLK